MEYSVTAIIFSKNNSFGIIKAKENITNKFISFITKGFVFSLHDSFEVDIENLSAQKYQGANQYTITSNSDYTKIDKSNISEPVTNTKTFKNKTLKPGSFKINDSSKAKYCPEEGIDTVWARWKDTDGNVYKGVISNPEKYIANAVFSGEGTVEENPIYGPQTDVSSIEVRAFDLNKPEFLLKNLGFNSKSIDWALRVSFRNLISDPKSSLSDIENEIRRGRKENEFSGLGEKTIQKIMVNMADFQKEQGTESSLDVTTKFKKDLKEMFIEFRVEPFFSNYNDNKRVSYINQIHKGFVSILEGNRSSDFSEKYGVKHISEIPKLIRRNPYVLILLPNKGFKTVDSIALQMKIEPGSLFRQEACVNGILDGEIQNGFGSEGDIYLDRETLFDELKEALTIADEDGFSCLFEKKDSDLLFQSLREKGNTDFYSWMFLDDSGEITEKFTNKKNYDNEQMVFESVKQAIECESGRRKPIMDSMKLGVWIQNFEKKESDLMGFTYKLSDEQRKAVVEINSNNQSIFCMTGFAGTGKSTVSKAILELLELENNGDRNGIECLAVSGMASRRITEATGFKSSTIMSYSFNPKRAQNTKILFIDEASMVDTETMAMLFSKINMNTVKVILVGDVGQLPPIGRGIPFKNILESGWVRSVSLEKIFRQNEDAVLTTFAKGMREEDIPETMFEEKHSDFEFTQIPDQILSKLSKEIYILQKNEEPSPVQKNRIKKLIEQKRNEIKKINFSIKDNIKNLLVKYKSDFIKDISNFQLISPMSVTVVGTEELNRLAQDILNDNEQPFLEANIKIGQIEHFKRFKLGDKVIHTKNENWFIGKNLGFYINGRFTKIHSEISGLKQDYGHKAGSDWVIRILNGMVGVIDSYNKITKIIRVKYAFEDIEIGVDYSEKDLGTLHLGYCLTVHKLQGSEAKTVVFVVSPSHQNMINNNLLYTGLTRGKTKGYLVGSKMAFKHGLKQHGTIRHTMLPHLFDGLFWELTDEAQKTILFDADDWGHTDIELKKNTIICSSKHNFKSFLERKKDSILQDFEENFEDLSF